MDATLRVAGTAVVLRDGVDGLETLLLRRPETGSFAGAWVFPGGAVESGDILEGETETDAARRAAVRETAEEAGLRVRDLQPVSCWTPPVDAPRRYRTWFFLARSAEDELVLNPAEVTDAVWVTPAGAFDRHAAGSLVLFPPTWVTLHGLLPHRTVDEAYAAAGTVQQFVTHSRVTPSGRLLTWAGDEEHPHEPGAPGARHRLTAGPPPWRYERG
ncbi:NUDIX hydrolase [Microbacterium sp.]|uniref:NUDIX hydrolase n=1 Tax=Microbacterium sp. TaxID=51671 RepID=UPI002810EF77|nr:NUDIX hydrolase [Microbacterium sp.]